MKKTIIIVIAALSLFSCKKEVLTGASMDGPSISSDLTVFDKVRSARYGLNGYPKGNTDSALASRKGGIVFVGDSYVENWWWYNWNSSWSGLPVINRGFGGTTWQELTPYVDSIITLWQPKVIVMYAGENEYLRYMGTGRTSKDVASSLLPQFNRFYDSVRKKNPQAKIIVQSMFTCPKLFKGGYSGDINNVTNPYPTPLWNKAMSYKLKATRDAAAMYLDVRKAVPTNQPIMWQRDSIHPSSTAYPAWLKMLKPVVDSVYKTQLP